MVIEGYKVRKALAARELEKTQDYDPKITIPQKLPLVWRISVQKEDYTGVYVETNLASVM